MHASTIQSFECFPINVPFIYFLFIQCDLWFRCLCIVKNEFIEGINFCICWPVQEFKTNNMRSNIYYHLQCKQFLNTNCLTKDKRLTLYHAPFSIHLEQLPFPFVLIQLFLPNHFPWCVINFFDVLTRIIEQLIYYVPLHDRALQI